MVIVGAHGRYTAAALAIAAAGLLFVRCSLASDADWPLDAAFDAPLAVEASAIVEVSGLSTDTNSTDVFSFSSACGTICKVAARLSCSKSRTTEECEELCLGSDDHCPFEGDALVVCVAGLAAADFVCDAVRGLPKPDPTKCADERMALSECELDTLRDAASHTPDVLQDF